MVGRTSATRSDAIGWGTGDHPLAATICELLLSNGDGRISLNQESGCNAYGCSPHPQSDAINFASSTASSISAEALIRLEGTLDQLKIQSHYVGMKSAFSTAMEAARAELMLHLNLPRKTDVVFAASGTDAQLIALCLARMGSAGPISTIVVGGDQTGSGSVFSGAGRHFGTHTAQGASVERGNTISGVDDAYAVLIPFLKEDGDFRSLAEMDAATIEAVEREVRAGRRVLLQAMDASKFGWRAPSDACLALISEKWSGQVQIAIDACQMRLSRSRLRALLLKQYMILVTGSKFFTGPAFSGALLIPPFWRGRPRAWMVPPPGLSDYSSAYDWPTDWNGIRTGLRGEPRVGQWLRWQAALEEMKLYFAVPANMRGDIAAALAGTIERAIDASSVLQLLPLQPSGQSKKRQSIFSFVLTDGQTPLSPQACVGIYRSLRNAAPEGLKHIGDARPCHIGQPVALAERHTAAIRLSISARTVRSVWSPDSRIMQRNFSAQYADISTVIARLEQELSKDGRGKDGLAL